VGDGAPDLEKLVADELDRSAPAAAQHLADEIRRRHGEAVASVVFYGSCLRKQTQEGVLDFYVLVDSYRAVYRSRVVAWLNAALPPNVFYLEIDSPIGTLRSKYAIISTRDFEAATAPDSLRTGIWARFSQPAVAVYSRDEAARLALIGAAAAAIRTALQQGLLLLPGEGESVCIPAEELWQHTLSETYAVEMRPEAPETIRSVTLAAPERFERAARAGLDSLAQSGRLAWQDQGAQVCVTLPAQRRRRARRAWRRRKPLRKAIYLIALLKSATTFGDWLPYVLWKLERHTGEQIEVTERQRRHPLIWGWPVFLRILRQRLLR
jgi:hypothetical protein